MEIVKGYKATDKNMQCRGFQFEIGKWYEHKGDLEMCNSGFHFCEYPSGPWYYYRNEGTRVFKVEAKDVVKGKDPGADKKHVARFIRLTEEITITGNWNVGDWNTGDGNIGSGNTGDWNTGSGNAGDHCSGDLCHGEAPYFIFNKPAKRADVDRFLVHQLSILLQKDEEIDPGPFLSLPNASIDAIKELHDAHKAARTELSQG